VSTGRRDERGQITLLVIGFFAIVVLLVAVVADLAKAYLVHSDLSATADAAALAAADGVGRRVYAGGLQEQAEIDHQEASALVEDYLTRWIEPDRYRDLSWSVDVSGNRVVVRMNSRARLPFAVPGSDGTAMISTESSAMANVR
jgi:hypothetical protein